jgi:hypothetical protein
MKCVHNLKIVVLETFRNSKYHFKILLDVNGFLMHMTYEQNFGF